MTRIIAAAAIAAAACWLVLPAGAETIRIEAENLVFSPPQVSAHVGDTIEWVNSDFVAHTATAKNHDFDVAMPPNTRRRWC